MSTMSLLDLQCQEAQELFTLFLESGDDVPTPVAVEMLQQITYNLTPIAAWETTLPYMLQWAWEQFAIKSVTSLH